MKRNLLINTLNNNDLIAMNAVQVFKKRIENLEVINTDGTKINGCIGCTDCWIKTPGICLVNDDFNQIFMDFINSDSIILLTEGNVGFISYKMKNIIDRLLPLAVPYTRISKGTMKHISSRVGSDCKLSHRKCLVMIQYIIFNIFFIFRFLIKICTGV